MRAFVRTITVLWILMLSHEAGAFTHSCNYGSPPPNSPQGTTNPTVYSRIDWTTSENSLAQGLRMLSRAWDPGQFLIGQLEHFIPLPQQTPGWLAHVVVLGSPFAVGQYTIYSEASAYMLIYFEGRLWPVDMGFYSTCLEYGHIP